MANLRFLAQLVVAGVALLTGLGALPLTASAQGYPSKPVRMIAPFSSGGGVDVPRRAVSERLSARWSHGVAIENRAGGGSLIGTGAVARAASSQRLYALANSPRELTSTIGEQTQIVDAMIRAAGIQPE